MGSSNEPLDWMVRLRVVMERLEPDRRVKLLLGESRGETPCLQALHEPSVLVRGGNPACIGFAHPPVPMTHNIIVQRITQGAWNQDAEIEEGPESGEVPHNSQRGRGFGVNADLLQQEEGGKVFGRKLQCLQNLLSLVGLKRAELERLVGIMIDQKVHPGMAPIAHTIEHNDVLMPGPLLGCRIQFACHWLHFR